MCTTLYSLCEGIVVYPYELIKTRQQIMAPNAPCNQQGTFEQILRLRQERGLCALYRGFTWNVLGGIPSEVAYYVGYTKAKNVMLETSVGKRHPSAVYLAAGAMADALSVFLWVPADVVSQRLQLVGTSASCYQASYPPSRL